MQTIRDCVFERNIAIEIRGWRKDQLAVGQSNGTIADRHRAAFGNGLAIDGGDAEAIAIQVGVIAEHVDGDGPVLFHGELVVPWHRRGIHHAVVSALGGGVASGIGQGGIHCDGAIDRQIRGGNGQSNLGLADVIGGQDGAGVRYPIPIPVHIEAITNFGIGWQTYDDIHAALALIG